jgi:hypothetical protein
MDWLRVALGWLGAATFVAVAGYCVARLVAAARAPGSYPGRHRAVDTAHVLMGVGMAAMLSPAGGPFPTAAWQTVFLLMTVWFAGSWWQSRGTARHDWHGGWHGNGLHHALGAAAMLYMLTAMRHSGHSGAPWMTGGLGPEMSGLALPLVGWTLAAYFLGSAIVLVRWRSPAGPAGLPALITAQAAMTACQTTMAAGTGVMLVAMLA